MSNITESKQKELVIPGFSTLENFELVQRQAHLLSDSTLVPKEYQNNISNCVIALNMANRMHADPLMVMQNLYIVYGKPGWSSQFMIATFNASGRFSAMRYEWTGEAGKDSYGCKAWAIEKDTNQRLEGSEVTVAIAKKEGWYSKSGSKWQSMPQQMLMYRAASWFVRAYAPELAMGLQTEYEILDVEKPEHDQEIGAKANKETIDIDDAVFTDVDKPKAQARQEPVEQDKKQEPKPEESPAQEFGDDSPPF